MRLLDEIVDLLSDEKSSLTAALLKTNVLMHRVGHKELVPWVTSELQGYSSEDVVPTYRIIAARVLGNLSNMSWRQANVLLPTYQLPEKMRNDLLNTELRDSIRVLEEFVSKPTGHWIHQIAPEFHHHFNDVIKNGRLESAWTQMEPTQILHCVTEVRSRLLTFVLELQEKIGDAVNDEEIKEASNAADVPTMFHSIVTGDNATFVLGNNNTTHIKNSVKKNDFESLAAVLKQHGVGQEDVDLLKVAIADDEGKVDIANKQPGPSVRSWMKTMFGKAIETAWAIEVGVAGGLLTNAIQSFYF